MNTKYPLAEFIDLLATKSDYSKRELDTFFKAFFGLLEEALIEDKLVKIKGIGTFKLLLIEKRKSVSVQNGEDVEIPAHYRVSFQPDKELNDQVNGLLSLFESIEITEEQAKAIKARIEPEQTVETVEEAAEIEAENQSVREETSTVLLQEKPLVETALERESLLPAEKPTLPDAPQTEIPASAQSIEITPKGKPSSPNRSFAWVYTIAALAIVVMGGLFYTIWDQISGYTPPMVTQNEPKENLSITQSITESEIINPMDSTATDTTTFPAIQPQTPQIQEPETEKKETIKRGERLTIIAQRHYGNKVFWGYIFDENRSRIANPNNVPIGTEIVIPKKSKYNIDSANPESVRKAKNHCDEIFREFAKK